MADLNIGGTSAYLGPAVNTQINQTNAQGTDFTKTMLQALQGAAIADENIRNNDLAPANLLAANTAASEAAYQYGQNLAADQLVKAIGLENAALNPNIGLYARTKLNEATKNFQNIRNTNRDFNEIDKYARENGETPAMAAMKINLANAQQGLEKTNLELARLLGSSNGNPTTATSTSLTVKGGYSGDLGTKSYIRSTDGSIDFNKINSIMSGNPYTNQMNNALTPTGNDTPTQNASASPRLNGISAAGRAADGLSKIQTTTSSGKCATSVRENLERAGYRLPTGKDRTSAYMYADNGLLEDMGFQRIDNAYSQNPLKGDIVVFGKTDKHPDGHIAMFDGNNWVSDFRQRNINPYIDKKSAGQMSYFRDPRAIDDNPDFAKFQQNAMNPINQFRQALGLNPEPTASERATDSTNIPSYSQNGLDAKEIASKALSTNQSKAVSFNNSLGVDTEKNPETGLPMNDVAGNQLSNAIQQTSKLKGQSLFISEDDKSQGNKIMVNLGDKIGVFDNTPDGLNQAEQMKANIGIGRPAMIDAITTQAQRSYGKEPMQTYEDYVNKNIGNKPTLYGSDIHVSKDITDKGNLDSIASITGLPIVQYDDNGNPLEDSIAYPPNMSNRLASVGDTNLSKVKESNDAFTELSDFYKQKGVDSTYFEQTKGSPIQTDKNGNVIFKDPKHPTPQELEYDKWAKGEDSLIRPLAAGTNALIQTTKSIAPTKDDGGNIKKQNSLVQEDLAKGETEKLVLAGLTLHALGLDDAKGIPAEGMDMLYRVMTGNMTPTDALASGKLGKFKDAKAQEIVKVLPKIYNELKNKVASEDGFIFSNSGSRNEGMIPAFIDENGNFKINRYKTNSESDKANAIAHGVPINDSSKFVALVPDQLGYKAEKFIRDLTDKYAKDSFAKSTHQRKYISDEARNRMKQDDAQFLLDNNGDIYDWLATTGMSRDEYLESMKR
jgi:hypothetical protein|nr:MAG TPA: putative cytoplasmic protein [Caudoviricetes sp.]